jgi:hypothetical protein
MRCLRSLRAAATRGRDALLAVAALVALAALLTWIATSVQAQKANEGSAEAFIPLEAECLVQVRFAEVWGSDFGKLWRETLPGDLRGAGGRHPAQVIEEFFATDPESIETLLVAQANAPLATELLSLSQFSRLIWATSPFNDKVRYTKTDGYYDTRATFTSARPPGDTQTTKTARIDPKTETRPSRTDTKIDGRTETLKTDTKTGPATNTKTAIGTRDTATARLQTQTGTARTDGIRTGTTYYGGTMTFTGRDTRSFEQDLPTLLDLQPLAIVTVKQARDFDKARELLEKNAVRKAYKGMTYYVPRYYYDLPPAVLFINGKTMIRGPEQLIRQGIDAQGAQPKNAARLDGLRKNADKHLYVDWLRGGGRPQFRTVQSEDDLYQFIHQLKPLKALKSKQVAYMLGKELLVQSQLQFGTPAEAEAAVPALKELLHLRRFIEPGILLSALDREIERASGDETREEKLTTCMLFFEKVDAAMRDPAVKQTGAAVAVTVKADADFAVLRAKAKEVIAANWADEVKSLPKRLRASRANLRRIATALDDFDVAYRELPPPAICKDGKPLLSWRVAILPLLGEKALYEEFKLDEPWDSDHNKKLIAKMPAVFAAPAIKSAEGHTHYQAVVGKGAGWELVPDPKARLGAKGFPLFGGAFADGNASTLALVEATDAVPWTKPADLVYEAGKPLPKIGGLYKDRVNLMMFDLRPMTVRLPISDNDLKAIITRAGGEPLGASFWERVEMGDGLATQK